MAHERSGSEDTHQSSCGWRLACRFLHKVNGRNNKTLKGSAKRDLSDECRHGPEQKQGASGQRNIGVKRFPPLCDVMDIDRKQKKTGGPCTRRGPTGQNRRQLLRLSG